MPLVDSKHNPDLPAIFSLPEFPLLLYAPVDYDRAWYVEGCGVFTVTHDRRLLHWEKPGQGGRQIAENIPAGKRIWHTHRPQDGIARAILYRQGSGTATIIQFDVARRACRIAQLALIQPTIKDVCPHAGVLLVISRSKADAFDPATGNRLATCDTAPERVWLGGRFFRHQQEVEVLGYDGKHLVWTVTDLYPFVISHLFEREGIDGPITLSLDGRITDIETERTLAQVEASHWTASALSPDGRRLVIQRTSAQQGPRRLVVDLNGGQVSPVPDSLHLQQVLQPEIDQYIRRGSALRHRFMHIGCRDSETLILLTRRGTRLPIAFPTGRGSLPFLPGDVGAPISALRTFRRIPGAPYRLRVAQWSDGSAAFLDARGLLHLKSSAPSAPEVTIVLAHPRAAWSPSRPYATGDSSYIRRGTRKDRQHFAEAMQEFIRRIR